MLYFGRWKTGLILAMCLFGALFCLPNTLPAPASWLPWHRVNLGLDLRGGSYLLLEVDMRSVVRDRLETVLDQVRQALRPGNLFYAQLIAQPDQNRALLRLRDPAQTSAALAALAPLAKSESGTSADIVLAEAGDGQITLTLSDAGLLARARSAVSQSIEIVRRRIDESGVLDPVITRQGDDQIVVQLPGISDPDRIKTLLGKTAHMTFRMVDDTVIPTATTAPPGDDFLPVANTPGQRLPIRRKVDVDGADLTDAHATFNSQSNEWVVSLTFNSVGAARFADISAANVGKRFAIVLDDQVLSAPVFREAIRGGAGQISGSFTARSANDLAVLLRAGALPAPLTVVEERSIGPELGADSIRAGALSLAIGFLLVIGFMGTFYGLFGWFANVAVVMNLVLILGVMSVFGFTLTLPGMAGILLTLGMAVDANILINERIREEARAGRAPFQALENGFKRAYATIFDTNVTAILAHVMLFAFGSGPVRGFALTITVGVATSLFTSWMLTRLLVSRWYVSRRPALLPV